MDVPKRPIQKMKGKRPPQRRGKKKEETKDKTNDLWETQNTNQPEVTKINLKDLDDEPETKDTGNNLTSSKGTAGDISIRDKINKYGGVSMFGGPMAGPGGLLGELNKNKRFNRRFGSQDQLNKINKDDDDEAPQTLISRKGAAGRMSKSVKKNFSYGFDASTTNAKCSSEELEQAMKKIRKENDKKLPPPLPPKNNLSLLSTHSSDSEDTLSFDDNSPALSKNKFEKPQKESFGPAKNIIPKTTSKLGDRLKLFESKGTGDTNKGPIKPSMKQARSAEFPKKEGVDKLGDKSKSTSYKLTGSQLLAPKANFDRRGSADLPTAHSIMTVKSKDNGKLDIESSETPLPKSIRVIDIPDNNESLEKKNSLPPIPKNETLQKTSKPMKPRHIRSHSGKVTIPERPVVTGTGAYYDKNQEDELLKNFKLWKRDFYK